ncbi:hypothetical protein F5B22DRAFT_610545 [Xylaria bambusicola]|uniref:uncharacterized protein n=1 Tax=Xylaria bambusicola TaxID=326684 RepID=UPI002007A293|nr:uncharacterized protein F5B22DRAFT_610545 [Xylaria bambusicola]KAI0514738.1 hypothetical protein F5B22DRAFT_610545 [Xylaria bambusicola]
MSKLLDALKSRIPNRRLQERSYRPLDAGENERLTSPSPSTSTLVDESQHSSQYQKIKQWYPRVLLLVSALTLFVSSTTFIQQHRHRAGDVQCTRRMSAPSPLLEAVEYEWRSFDDSYKPDVYSGYPSEKSEKAWGDLWDFGAFSVPLDSLRGLNKSSIDGNFRNIEDELGGGVGGLLEGAHQIHCLNLVRQFIYRDHWDYSQLPSFSGGPATRRHHVDHCVATLRKVLTCQSDVTPYVYQVQLDGTAIGASAPRKCRKFSKLVDWVNNHSLFDTVE